MPGPFLSSPISDRSRLVSRSLAPPYIPPFPTPARSSAILAQPDALLEPLTPLQQLWAYITLGASPIVTEELAPLLGGLAASQGQLRLGVVVAVITTGGWVATTLLYVLGRWRGRWVRRRFPKVAGHVKRTLRAVRRRPWRSALAVRFAFGARLLLPLACGAAHLRLDVYLLGTLVSSLAWSALFAWIGFWFGETAVAGLRKVRAYDQYVVGALLALGALGWWWWRRRARRAADAFARAGEP